MKEKKNNNAMLQKILKIMKLINKPAIDHREILSKLDIEYNDKLYFNPDLSDLKRQYEDYICYMYLLSDLNLIESSRREYKAGFKCVDSLDLGPVCYIVGTVCITKKGLDYLEDNQISNKCKKYILDYSNLIIITTITTIIGLVIAKLI